VKKILIAFLILLVTVSMISPPGSREVLKKMHDRYAGKWYKTFSFNQTTEVYRNDSLKHTETWYENIKFPKDFRIDFGDPDSGKAVIYKNDSSYFFRNGKLAGVRPDNNDLLFLLGGMYFYKFDEVISKMKSYGYDLDKFHEDTWKGKEVYVIGAGKGEDSVNQLWIEKENYSPVRMIKIENNNKEEALFEDHVKLGGGYTETLVYFFINSKLVQVEKYHDLKGDIEIDPSIFDAQNFVKLKL
jgi:outer membrane lipoprotein-sorting protein